MSARDMFADMGIPLPPPITAKPISRPIYNNRDIDSFLVWRQTNLQALIRYWHQLVAPSDADVLTVEDFRLFALSQYDSELDFREALRADYNSKSQIP